MPRKGPAPRRDLMPDPVYRSVVVTQVVNKILQRGKRSIAEKIVYDALADIEKKYGRRSGRGARSAPSRTCAPRSRSAAGASAAPPTRCRSRSVRVGATTLAVRWVVGYARQRREKTMAERLANELMDASTGSARRSSARTTFRRWRSRTGRSRTTGGDAFDSVDLSNDPARPARLRTPVGAPAAAYLGRAPAGTASRCGLSSRVSTDGATAGVRPTRSTCWWRNPEVGGVQPKAIQCSPGVRLPPLRSGEGEKRIERWLLKLHR